MFALLQHLAQQAPRKAPATLALILSAALLLGGCSWFQFPGVYRLDIQQGNIITQDMVDQLQLGMTKRQVNFVLGTPLIQDSFNLDRWDYYYSLRDSQGEISRRRFTTYFTNDALTNVEGDYSLPAPEQPAPEQTPPEQPDLPTLDEGFSSTAPNAKEPSATAEAATLSRR